MTWFPLDLILVGVDWVEIFMGGAHSDTANAARMGKASRTLRILRMVRLLRLARMKEVLKIIRARCRVEALIVMFDLAKIIVALLGVAHFIACGWIGVSKTESIEDSWIYVGSYDAFSLEYRYLLSLHWSIAQFQGGMDEIVPVGSHERAFAVCACLICFVMAAAFVSALTSEMTRLHILASQQARQLNVLHRYLKQSRISDKLSYRVQRNAQHAMSEQQRLMPESEVELLSLVSEPLRVELHFEMYSPVLEVHPFLSDYVFECPQVMRKVCHEAMGTLLIANGDVIFNAGEMPSFPKMYIVCGGALEYIPVSGNVLEVHQETWLSEAVLWTKWMHRGVLKATGEGRLGVLDANKFQHIVSSFETDVLDPRRYATAFVKFLNNLIDKEDIELVTDLPLGEERKICQHAFNGTRRSTAKGRNEALRQMFHSRKSAFMDPNMMPKGRASVFVKTNTSESLG